MISGALMLKKDDFSYRQLLKKIFFRLIIPLLAVSAYIYFKMQHHSNIIEFVKAFLSNDINLTFWYIYALIGMYLCIPILRKLVKNMEKKDYYYIFILWILIEGVLPIICSYGKFKIAKQFNVPIIAQYIPYYLLGYYIFELNELKNNKKNLIISIIIATICLSISVMASYIDIKILHKDKFTLDSIVYINMILLTTSICYIVKYFFENKKYCQLEGKILATVSATTYGVYLSHQLIIGKIKPIFYTLDKFLPIYIAYAVYIAMYFLMLCIVIAIPKNIPYIKKFINKFI